MKYGNHKIAAVLLMAVIISSAGCSPKKDALPQEEVLVSVGDSSLMLRDVVMRIPSGLSEEDSVAMFNSIVERWVRTMMLNDLAAENVDELDKINRLAADYRDNLIIERYLRSKIKEVPEPSEQDIREYYDRYGSDMKLEAPLVKGIYIKVADTEERLGDIRKWMATATPVAVDNIEKSGLRQASQYEYFKDNWIDWNEVAEQIPYRFYDADAFLGSTKDFETSYSGSTYLLHIYEFLPSGSVMPYEYAAKKIAAMMGKENKASYRARLLSSLYAKGFRDGKLKPGLYDPVKQKMNK